jgi:phosphonate metabolism protein PhnN/1,5-bisphosphokinase (PRPP-forming)
VKGRLVLIIGPSGSGKDTLMAGAARVLASDQRFRFARRSVTRPAAEEDHESLDLPGFLARRARGDFALHWQAHGLYYGIPADIAADLGLGRIVVANVSRGILAEAAARFPVTIIEITVPDEVRAARLRERGREAPAEVAARLARDVPRPPGLPVATLVNDGNISEGIAALVDFLMMVPDEPG